MDNCSIQYRPFPDENQIENEEEYKPPRILTPKKIKILVAVVLGNLFIGSCYAIMAPIFPPKAEEKGASETESGFVFGIYQLTLFISSPIYGKFMPVLRPKFMMKAGMLVSGVCNILFGLLDYIPAGSAFIGFALTLRFFDALGASAFFTASYATLGSELSEIIGRAMSLTETAFALGITGGPVFGGFLFELGGFKLPFIVIGLILIAGTIINVFLFSGASEVPSRSISAFELLKNIDFLIDVLAISSGFALLCFNEASLEPHLRKQLDPSPVTMGLLFLATGLTDAVFAPVCGYFAEKVPNAQYITFLGALLSIICFFIIGPAPFFNFKIVLGVVIVAQILLGLVQAALVVCSFTHGMKHTIERGFPDEVGTYGVISGVLFSAATFGGFVGPSLGGILIDEIGYKNTTMVAAGLGITVAVTCATRLTHLFFKKRRERR